MKIECGVRVLAVILIAASITSCVAPDMRHQIVISARDQKLALLDRGNVMAIYPVSTSKFGLGDWQRSSYTPLGKLEIAKKIGDNAPPGAVFKDRRRTGGCADLSRKTPMLSPAISTSTALRRNDSPACPRVMDVFGCVPTTLSVCTKMLVSAPR